MPPNCKLTQTTQDFTESIARFLLELGEGEKGFSGVPFARGEMSLEEQLRRLEDMAEGRGLESWQVPMTTCWLVDQEGSVVGTSRLRHRLTDALLEKGGHIGYYVSARFRGRQFGKELMRLTIEEANKKGIARVLVAVDTANTRSVAAIEANGAVLEDERVEK